MNEWGRSARCHVQGSLSLLPESTEFHAEILMGMPSQSRSAIEVRIDLFFFTFGTSPPEIMERRRVIRVPRLSNRVCRVRDWRLIRASSIYSSAPLEGLCCMFVILGVLATRGHFGGTRWRGLGFIHYRNLDYVGLRMKSLRSPPFEKATTKYATGSSGSRNASGFNCRQRDLVRLCAVGDSEYIRSAKISSRFVLHRIAMSELLPPQMTLNCVIGSISENIATKSSFS